MTVAVMQPGSDLSDIAWLTSELDHLARSFWDVQKTRIMLQLRLKAWEQAGGGATLDFVGIATTVDVLKSQEDELDRLLTKKMREHPLNAWIVNTPGLGVPTMARLLGLVGPLDNYANPAKLWRYCGLAVIGGASEKRKRGEGGLHFSPMAKTTCFLIGAAIVRNRRYAPELVALYDTKKAEYEAREPVGESRCPFGQLHRSKQGKIVKCPKAHLDAAARRYMVKRVVRDMWIEWRRLTVHEMQPSVGLSAVAA